MVIKHNEKEYICAHTPRWCSGKESTSQGRSHGFDPWVQKTGWESPLEKEMATYSSIMAGKSHAQRKLVGYSVWGRWGGHKESDTTDHRGREHTHIHMYYIGALLIDR